MHQYSCSAMPLPVVAKTSDGFLFCGSVYGDKAVAEPQQCTAINQEYWVPALQIMQQNFREAGQHVARLMLGEQQAMTAFNGTYDQDLIQCQWRNMSSHAVLTSMAVL